MKQLAIGIMLLFSVALTSQNTIALTNTNTQEFGDENTQSISNETTRIHLEMILNDLIDNNLVSKKQIAILNNFQELVNFKWTTKGYTFEAVDKKGINLLVANRIAFWRMDVETNKALYELYVSKSENETQKHSYAFELENGSWKLTRY